MRFTLYSSDVLEKPSNCLYATQCIVTDVESLQTAVCADYVAAQYKDNYRAVSNFQISDCLAVDCDNDDTEDTTQWITPDLIRALLPGVSFAVHYSRHHNVAKSGKAARPRFHVFFPIKPLTDSQRYKDMKVLLNSLYPYFDGNAVDAARFFYGTAQPTVEVVEGECTLDEYLTSLDPSIADILTSQTEDVASTSVEGQGLIAEGSRNSTMSHYAGRVIKRLGDTKAAKDAFLEEAKKCTPPLEEAELNAIWKSATKFFYQKIVTDDSYVPADDFATQCQYMPSDFTDVGQANVLKKVCSAVVAYTPATGYLCYDGIVWRESKELALRACIEFLNRQLSEARDYVASAKEALLDLGIPSEAIAAGGKALERYASIENRELIASYNKAVTFEKFVLKRRDLRYIESALKTLSAFVVRDINEFDSQAYYLNTPKGTVDLRSGTMKAHEASDYLMNVTAVAPDSVGARLWKQTLSEIFCDNKELISYVKQNIGMVAIGKVLQEAMIIAYGDGSNGKSTFWNVIARVLGNYSVSIAADALVVGANRNTKYEKAELKGKRLVIASELQEGVRLSTSMVKQLTSTDPIAAERKYKDPFSFIPSHTLVLYTNHLPKIGAMDDGIWRRLIVIPFRAKIQGKKDIKNYAEHLYETCAGAILQWIIEGAQEVQAKEYKPNVPSIVQEAINQYREDSNWLGAFIDECCELNSTAEQRSGEFYQEYRSYALRNGEYVRNTGEFYQALESYGLTRKRKKNGVYILGIRLKPDFPEV